MTSNESKKLVDIQKNLKSKVDTRNERTDCGGVGGGGSVRLGKEQKETLGLVKLL